MPKKPPEEFNGPHLPDFSHSTSNLQFEATPMPEELDPDRVNRAGIEARSQYRAGGQVADLEAAISAFQQAIQATPPDVPVHPAPLSNLSVGLLDRYERTSELADLDTAISFSQQAVQASTPDLPDLPEYFSNLGAALSARYQHTKDLADLEAAIAAFQQAVQTTSPGLPAMSAFQNNLGTALRDRYQHTRDVADLEASIAALQQAVQSTPSDSPDLPGRLHNLSNGLSDRYEHTVELADLDAAISLSQQAVQATPSDSPDQILYLRSLGIGLRDRYVRTRRFRDLEAAITAWEKIWFGANVHFAVLPVGYQLGQQRLEATTAANLVTAYMHQAKRHLLRAPSSFRRALEVSEGSKSRLLTQLVGRGPLPLPMGLTPQVAACEQQLLTTLTTLDTLEQTSYNHATRTRVESNAQHCLQSRQVTLGELEHLWANIEQLGQEGAEYVALRRGLTPTWQDFVHIAKTLGPTTALLSFFATFDRGMFFLFRDGWRIPRVVMTPLEQADWTDLMERFRREINRYTPHQQRGETWDHALRALLDQAQPYLAGVERLILAPAGNGHLLPWAVLAERAGWCSPTGRPLPLVTVPALGMLPRLRQRPRDVTGPALVVGNPLSDLPFATEEATLVAQLLQAPPLLGSEATKGAVLAHLAEASLIHLATHAFFDSDDPLESGIVLVDGVLTAREILEHRLQADLLVLSACESGQVGSLGGEELAGLSQAFLQAGVRSVLVSLWPVNDSATAALMQAFYTARQAGADKAKALRQAMTQIQQDPRWAHPYYWGAFVLIGDWE